MQHVLVIRGSLFGEEARSARLAADLVATLRERHEGLDVTVRDLARDPVPHLAGSTWEAFARSADERSDAQREALALSDALIEEVQRADAIVLTTPMYNFGVSSAFKAWYDHVARVGVTFRYTSEGPQGLLEDRPVYVVSVRGGRYAGTPADNQTPWLSQILNFIGLESIEFVHAEGMASGQSDEAYAQARERIEAIAA